MVTKICSLELTITPATRLAATAANFTPSSRKGTVSSKRTHASDSEPESEVISTARSLKPPPKRLRASATASSSKVGVSRARNDIQQESGSTSESDIKPLNSYANSIDDVVDTPATTVSSRSSSSTRNKGKGKAVAAPKGRASTRPPVEVTDSQNEDEDDESVGEPEDDESELSEPAYEDEESEEEDEYNEEDEISIPLPKGKGKGKAKAQPVSMPAKSANKGKGKAAFRTSSVTPTLAAVTDEQGEGSTVDGLSETFLDDASVSTPGSPPVIAAPVRAISGRRRQTAARAWRGGGTRV